MWSCSQLRSQDLFPDCPGLSQKVREGSDLTLSFFLLASLSSIDSDFGQPILDFLSADVYHVVESVIAARNLLVLAFPVGSSHVFTCHQRIAPTLGVINASLQKVHGAFYLVNTVNGCPPHSIEEEAQFEL